MGARVGVLLAAGNAVGVGVTLAFAGTTCGVPSFPNKIKPDGGVGVLEGRPKSMAETGVQSKRYNPAMSVTSKPAALSHIKIMAARRRSSTLTAAWRAANVDCWKILHFG